MGNKKDKPVIIAEGKLVATGRKFQYILLNGVKKFVCGKNCLKLIALFLLLSSTSCVNFLDEEHYHVDLELVVFVNRFYKEAEKRNIQLGRDMIILLDKIPVHGRTTVGLSQIKIDRYFATSNLVSKYQPDSLAIEYVVFHEMSHLLLHRDHVSDNVYSIMTANEQWMSDYQTDADKRAILIEELFSTTPQH